MSIIAIKYSLLVFSVLLSLTTMAFAKNSYFIFVIDEKDKPVFGYEILNTPNESIFLGKLEPLKKWIILPKSELYIARDGCLYSVKNSVIIDKARGVVLYFIDLEEKKPITFSLETIKIDRDVKYLLSNKSKILSNLKTLFSDIDKEKKVIIADQKEPDLLAVASHYEEIGQLDKAITTYKEILKKDGFSHEIVNKIALLYYRSGNFNKAREFFKKLPQNDENVKRLVGILIIEKKFDEALKILKNTTLQDKKHLYYLRGIIYYLVGEKNEAYKELLELSKIDKELAESLRDLLR